MDNHPLPPIRSPKRLLLAVCSDFAGITDYISVSGAYSKHPEAFMALHHEMQAVIQRAQAQQRKREAAEMRNRVKQPELF